ncbi:MAG TPA: hypothetical protein VJ576_03400 [Rhodocyclaceae bacterium]|nr:hypothetical protein [Rhodocyclaceae bacterium]
MEVLALLVFLAFVAWLVLSPFRRKAAERPHQELEGRAGRQVAEACAYIANLNRDRVFVPVWMPDVSLKDGEFGCLQEPSTLHELRTRRISMGAGTRVRIGKVPIYLGGGESIPVEDIRPVADGNLHLTNRRLVFLSPRRSAAVALKDVIGIDASLDAITVHTSKNEKPKSFTVGNPAKWSLLIKLMAGEELHSPALPEGLALTAEPTATPGEVKFSAHRIAGVPRGDS